MSELISVIVPIYNVEKYLEKCIDSILNQTYRNLEIILVDDGSTDGSLNICEGFQNKDSRIRLLHKENGGQSSARNMGLDVSTGKYIMFIDSDDYIKSVMVEELYNRIKEDESDIVSCSYISVDENGKVVNESEKVHDNEAIVDQKGLWKDFYNTKSAYYIVPWNKIYKRHIFENLRFVEGKIFEDEYIFHKIIDKCKKVTLLDKELYYYVQRTNSTMGNNSWNYKRFYGVDAIIDRSLYFENKRMQEFAEKSLLHSAVLMEMISKNVDMKEIPNKSAYKLEKKKYNQAFFKIARKSRNIKFLMHGFSMVLGVNVYKLLHLYR